MYNIYIVMFICINLGKYEKLITCLTKIYSKLQFGGHTPYIMHITGSEKSKRVYE